VIEAGSATAADGRSSTGMAHMAPFRPRSFAASSESVASAELFCAECRQRADSEALGWRAYLVDADDYDGDEVLFFCPLCAARELQSSPATRRHAQVR
jgi:hypothetical protein